jgi:hypothetical protein
MNKIIKYIIKENQTPVIFSCEMLHSDFMKNITVTSAGFLSVRYDDESNRFILKCFGESSSLKIKNNLKKDQAILERFFNN